MDLVLILLMIATCMLELLLCCELITNVIQMVKHKGLRDWFYIGALIIFIIIVAAGIIVQYEALMI